MKTFSLHRHLAFRLTVIGLCALTLVAAASAIVYEPSPPTRFAGDFTSAQVVEDKLVPDHREPPLPPPPPPPPPSPPPKPKPPPKPAANVDVYRGLGAWVDIYDSDLDPEAALKEMKRRGVKTLYLETANWRCPGAQAQTNPLCAGQADMVSPELVRKYADMGAELGIGVVGWYVPGFGDMDRDIRRSKAVLDYRTPKGNRFSGFAPDIETRGELINQIRAQHPDWSDPMVHEEARVRFNAGISDYSRRLREAVAPGTVLGSIVVDAKNNEKAPGRWAGFPWPDIGKYYDVILPMAYWSTSYDNGGKTPPCPGLDMDVFGYMTQVWTKTLNLMGTTRPMHLVGGVADCITTVEVAGYVRSVKELGSLGASLYDFKTTEGNSSRDAIWAELSRLT